MRKTNKIVAFAIAILFALSMVCSTTLVPNAKAGNLTFATTAYINLSPNPIGVGQTAVVDMFLDQVTPTATGIYGDVWNNFKLTITTPSGTPTTQTFPSASISGGVVAYYTPSTIGNYTFQWSFPGQTIVGTNPPPQGYTSAQKATIGNYYGPSTSVVATLIVQSNPVTNYPTTPLPTGYWQRPIDAENTNWNTIAGNWLGFASCELNTGAYNISQNYNPYTTSPTTAHIVWTKSVAFGGVLGGEFGNTESGSSYYMTNHNEPKFAPVIINGVLYYTNYPSSVSNPQGWTAIDLRTGKTLWTQPNTAALRCGQVLDYMSINQYGGTAYLWGISGTTYSMVDAMTGNFILNITGGPALTMMEAADGSLLGYYINATDNTLNMWNSTQCVFKYVNALPGGAGSSSLVNWRPPSGANIPFANGIQWTVKLPSTFNGVPINTIGTGFSIDTIGGNTILLFAGGSFTTWLNSNWQLEAGYSIVNGAQLFLVNQTETQNARIECDVAANGVYAECTLETLTWNLYDLNTGAKIWGPTVNPDTNSWGSIGSVNGLIAYGCLFSLDFGGFVNCFNLTNGNLIWTWNTGSSGTEGPYGIWPLWVAYLEMSTVAGGEILVGGGHEYNPPLYHGCQLYAINSTTGKLDWSILNFAVSTAPAVSDGYMVDLDSYTGMIDCFGQGQTATSVTTAPVINNAAQVLIKGTVTDQSPGQTCLGIPAAGTPAIADQYMTRWMEYLYMQQLEPMNATGVPVTLTEIDPNNNAYVIGTTTSDITGQYSYTFTPPVPGTYKIVATFGGSNSYFGSTAQTIMTFDMPATATASPTATPTSMVDTYFIPAIAGLFILIIAVAIVLSLLVLRKRP